MRGWWDGGSRREALAHAARGPGAGKPRDDHVSPPAVVARGAGRAPVGEVSAVGSPPAAAASAHARELRADPVRRGAPWADLRAGDVPAEVRRALPGRVH